MRAQVNASVKRNLKIRIERLQEKGTTLESILEAGVSFYENKITKQIKKDSNQFNDLSL